MDNASAKEIIDRTSDQNLKHMHEGGNIVYLIEGVFRERATLPDGTTKEQVEAMTQFQKIGILQQLIEKEDEVFAEPLSYPLVTGINAFLRKVEKDGFETATDMDLAEEYLDCPYCEIDGRVGPSHVGNTFYCYKCCETF